jgi:RNA polymerase sigma-70 factor (ECF subfamily)
LTNPAHTTPAATGTPDPAAFERLVAPHQAELRAHCYRMLGSAAEAEDAVQEALLRAWRGLGAFEGRSSLRSWLYRITTNVCLRMLERRPARMLPLDHGPPSDPHADLESPRAESAWLEPYPDASLGAGPASPEARYEQREAVELAFIAACQHLPERQRAVLLLRDVLGFSPAEIADALDATPAAVYSALQRAHQAVEERLPARSQQETLRSLGDARLRDLVRSYVDAWERNDVAGLMGMLTADATFAMPPRSEWFRGRAAIGAFLGANPLAPDRHWRLVPVRANGQVAFAFYGPRDAGGRFPAHGIEVVTFAGDGRVSDVTTFHDARAFARFDLPAEPPEAPPMDRA